MKAPFDSEAAVSLMGPELTRKDFQRIRDLAHSNFGLELREGKERLVAARLGKYVRAGGFRKFSEYVDHVVEDRTGESLTNLINALSTNHTSFFRENRHFDFMVHRILPVRAGRSLRIWSAACSTGEEPYSIAMCVLEQPPHIRPGTLAIVASDISTKVLQVARAGVYASERIEQLPPLLQSKYFDEAADHKYSVRREIRSVVDFRRINLMDPIRPAEPFDVIFCRNVMIYFNKETQTEVIGRLNACLLPGGYLFVGHSESLTGIGHDLEYVEPAIYRKPTAIGKVRGARR